MFSFVFVVVFCVNLEWILWLGVLILVVMLIMVIYSFKVLCDWLGKVVMVVM